MFVCCVRVRVCVCVGVGCVVERGGEDCRLAYDENVFWGILDSFTSYICLCLCGMKGG